MTYRLTKFQVEEFHKRGYLYPFRLWNKKETVYIRGIFKECFINNVYKHLPEENQFLFRPELVELLKRSQLTDRMSSIIGNDLFLWRTKAFIKNPKEKEPKEVPWHQDRYSWPLEPMVACSAWIAVDNVDVDNGCIHVIPGSHRKVIPHISSNDNHLFCEQADPNYFDASKAEPLILKAGEFALFNERVLHRSDINRSNRRRFGVAVRVLPPQVRVMKYDCKEHGLIQLRGTNPLKFNRIIEPREGLTSKNMGV